jgi:hypothetical protein
MKDFMDPSCQIHKNIYINALHTQFKTQRIHGHTSIYHFVITDNLAIVGI